MKGNKPKQKLTTEIGKLIEQTSYKKIGSIILIIIICCSFYFYLLSPYENGTNKYSINFLDSIFFSIVTFSSLGYGDILPEGFGKVIASLEVLAGLFFVAVFVGKIASEKVSALLQLTYSSENERRLADFSKDIYEKKEGINKALSDHNNDELHSLSKKTYAFMSSLYNYLQFHINQGGYEAFTHMAAPRRLFKALASLQEISIESIKTFGPYSKTVSKFEDIIYTIEKISRLVVPYHLNNINTVSILNKIVEDSNNFRKWRDSREIKGVSLKYRVEITEDLLERIKKELPRDKWERNTHKEIAAKLSISNKLCEKCIIRLIENGELPEFKK